MLKSSARHDGRFSPVIHDAMAAYEVEVGAE